MVDMNVVTEQTRMGKHIDFDDIVKVIYSDTIDEEMNILMAKVNAHIIQCQECRRVYDTILAIHDEVDAISLRMTTADRVRLKVIRALIGLERYMPETSAKIKDWIDNFKHFSLQFSVRVKSRSELYIGSNPEGADFLHPVAIGYRANKEKEANKTILIDDENELNQIKVDTSGKLTIQIDRELCEAGKLILLLNDETESSYIETLKLLNEDAVAAEFESVEVGCYLIIIQ